MTRYSLLERAALAFPRHTICLSEASEMSQPLIARKFSPRLMLRAPISIRVSTSYCPIHLHCSFDLVINQVVRTSYSDRFYTQLAHDSIQSWKDIEEWGDTYHECVLLGILRFISTEGQASDRWRPTCVDPE